MDEKLKAFGIKKSDEGLSQLISKGNDEEARAIIEKAKKEGIEIVKDSSVTELLGKVDLYEGIPEESYKLISEILMYVYNIEKEGFES